MKKKLENYSKFSLEAKLPEKDRNSFINVDETVKYTIEYFAPYFEEPKNKQ